MLLQKLAKILIRPFVLVLWGIVIVLTMLLNNISSVGLIAAALIITFLYVGAKLRNEDFSKLLAGEQNLSNIKQMNVKCERLADGPRNSTNSEKRYRVRQVLKNKDDILSCLFKDEESSLKQRIASQAIELVTVYIRLIENYYSRVRDIDDSKLNEIQQRIQINKTKLEKSENIELELNLKNSIELDETLLQRLKEEKLEIDSLNGKLSYIESSINLLKQQIISNDEQPLLDNVQVLVNESIALDNVLNERRKERNKL